MACAAICCCCCVQMLHEALIDSDEEAVPDDTPKPRRKASRKHEDSDFEVKACLQPVVCIHRMCSVACTPQIKAKLAAKQQCTKSTQVRRRV